MTRPHVFIVFITFRDALSYIMDTFNLILTKGVIECETLCIKVLLVRMSLQYTAGPYSVVGHFTGRSAILTG